MKQKAIETRLRKKLKSLGYDLKKSRRRDRQAADYGLYYVYDSMRNRLIGREWMDIREVESLVKKMKDKGHV
jgi:hypothetical protein